MAKRRVRKSAVSKRADYYVYDIVAEDGTVLLNIHTTRKEARKHKAKFSKFGSGISIIQHSYSLLGSKVIR